MIKSILAVSQDDGNAQCVLFQFDVPDAKFDLLSAVKKAANEYCRTDDGRDRYEYNSKSFNWGDFMIYVPNDICKKYGFTKIDDTENDEIVNFDEALVDLECDKEITDLKNDEPVGSYELIHADALTVDADVIVHQTNCKGVMGAGIAKQVRDQFPDVFKKYKALCDRYRHNTSELLGACQFVEENGKTICNAFGQDGFNKPGCNTDYIALRECLKKIAKRYSEKTVALPYKIGCGLAGGDWFIVETMIRDELVERGHCRVLVCQWP